MNFLRSHKLLLFTVLLLLLNLLSLIALPYKLDLTSNQAFTLSPATKKVIGNLDDIVTIKVFSSRSLPSRFLLLRQQLKDFLEEYRLLAKGKIRVEWLTTEGENEAVQLAQRLGIPQLQFSNIQQDKFQVSQGYFGLAMFYEDQKEVIPIIEEESNLEYQFTSSLLKITKKEKPVVGLVTGHGETAVSQNASFSESLLEKALGKEFLLETLTLEPKKASLVPDKFSALLVIGPKEEYEEESRFVLDQFLMQGKPILFFLDGVSVDNQLQTSTAKHQLNALLKNYGLSLKENLILDPSAAIANFNTGLTTFFTPYPYWIKIQPEGFSQHPATFGLQGMVLPWVSSIDLPQDDKRFQPLINSSPKAWSVEKNFNLNPTQKWQVSEEKTFVLAALATGEFTSAFKDQPLPKEFKQEKFKEKTDQMKLLLVGDSDSLNENLAASFQPNLHFLLNVLEFLTASENLAQIKVKQEDLRPLKKISPQTIEIIKYGSIVGLPLVVSLGGLGYLSWRSRREFHL